LTDALDVIDHSGYWQARLECYQTRIPTMPTTHSNLKPIAIPKSSRSAFQIDGDQRSKLMPITRLI
jgi:hypothetical protein